MPLTKLENGEAQRISEPLKVEFGNTQKI